MLNCQSYGRCENGQNWARVVRRVRSKKRNDGSALGVVYAPLVAVMHAGFSTTLCSRHTYIHANTKLNTNTPAHLVFVMHVAFFHNSLLKCYQHLCTGTNQYTLHSHPGTQYIYMLYVHRRTNTYIHVHHVYTHNPM